MTSVAGGDRIAMGVCVGVAGCVVIGAVVLNGWVLGGVGGGPLVIVDVSVSGVLLLTLWLVGGGLLVGEVGLALLLSLVERFMLSRVLGGDASGRRVVLLVVDGVSAAIAEADIHRLIV